MNTIEPVWFEVKGEGLDPTDYRNRMSGRISDWDITHDYILHQSLVKDFDEVSQHTLHDKFKELVEERVEPFEEIYPPVKELYSSIHMPPIRRNAPIYHMNDVIAVPNRAENGIFYIISNNKSKAVDIRDRVVESLEECPELFSALGVDDIDVHFGEEFTFESLERTQNVTDIEQLGSDEFEERIYEEVTPLSEGFANNVQVSFDYPQEPEYDILFSLAPGNTLIIEVEDHSGSDNQPDESDLIDNPSGESDYIRADHVYTVVNGVKSELLGNYKQKAELTNVTISERDQCSDLILEHIKEQMLPAALDMNTTPSF